MRTVTFLSVLEAIAFKVHGTADLLPTQDAAAFTASLNEHVRECWERVFWPEWTLTEQRYYRAAWTAASYSSGAEVYHAATDAYYQANTSATGTDVPGTSVKWTLLSGSDLRRYISLDQTGQTAIGEVEQVTPLDPRVYAGARRLGWNAGPDGIEIAYSEWTGTSVWVRFRRRPPVFLTTPVWSAASYSSGASVYHTTTGECYTANAGATSGDVPGASSKWTKIDFPAILKTAVVLFVASDHRDEDGQIESSNNLRSRAEEALVDAWNKAQGQQAQVRRFAVCAR